MLKTIVISFALLIGGMIGLHRALQNGAMLQFLDTHPDPVWTPRALYTLGQSYYLFQNLQQAATCYIRVEQKFPKSEQAEDSAFLYVQVLDDQRTLTREELIEAYQAYIDRYPKSANAEKALSRISSFKTGAR